MVMGELGTGIGPDPLLPIIQVILVDHWVLYLCSWQTWTYVSDQAVFFI